MSFIISLPNIVLHFIVAIELSGEILKMIVPWSLTETLLDPVSEPRAAMEKIVKEKVRPKPFKNIYIILIPFCKSA